MSNRRIKHLVITLYWAGFLALASSLYLLGIDSLSLGTILAVVGIVLEGIAVGLLILSDRQGDQ